MLNGAAINSFAINASQQQPIAASAEVRLEFSVTATVHDTVFASTNIACAFGIDGFCVRVPQAQADVVIAVVPTVSPYTSYSASSDIAFGLFLSPSSVFSVFALATIEFQVEAISNAQLGEAEIAIYAEILAKAVKIQPASVVIDCSIFVEESRCYTISGAFAETEIVFDGFFAPDLNFIRNTASFIECIFDIDSYVAVSPRLAETVIEFDIASTVILFRSNSATIAATFLFEALGTKVLMAEALCSIAFSLDTIANHVISTEAALGFMLFANFDGHHDAFAHSELAIELDIFSDAFHEKPVTSEIFMSYIVEADPRYYGRAQCSAPFAITIDPVEKHISLAEQIYADIVFELIVSPIPAMIQMGFSFVDIEFLIDSVGRLALQSYANVDLEFQIDSVGRLALQSDSDILFAFNTSPIASVVSFAYCDIVLEITIEHPDGIIGIYEPADECRTIFVQPDYNVIFVQYEERELRIAC